MKNNKNNLKSLLENLLYEADQIVRPTSMADFDAVPQDIVSLDQMIDRYLTQYERESIPTSEIYENNNIENLTNYLFEQEAAAGLDLTPGASEKPEKEADLDLSLDVGDEEVDEIEEEEEKIPVVQTPKINLQDFTRNIARLTNNYQSLIDFKSIILNRAKRYIQNNYDERTMKEMMEILKTSYDLEPVNISTHQSNSTEFPQPTTAVTGPVAGG